MESDVRDRNDGPAPAFTLVPHVPAMGLEPTAATIVINRTMAREISILITDAVEGDEPCDGALWAMAKQLENFFVYGISPKPKLRLRTVR